MCQILIELFADHFTLLYDFTQVPFILFENGVVHKFVITKEEGQRKREGNMYMGRARW